MIIFQGYLSSIWCTQVVSELRLLKQMATMFHIVCGRVANNRIGSQHTPAIDNRADDLRKVLVAEQFRKQRQ